VRRQRKARVVGPTPHAVVHFESGIVAIVGEPRARRVSLGILTKGNPAGSLMVSGSPDEMGQLAAKLGRIVLAVAKRR
jgi:hypothetical protein